jgi:hypothetical protein
MRWVGKETIIEHHSGAVAIEDFLQFERVIFLLKKPPSIFACYSLINRLFYFYIKQSDAKMFLSAIIAPVYWRVYEAF